MGRETVLYAVDGLSAKLKRLGHDRGATLFMTLIAAFQRYCIATRGRMISQLAAPLPVEIART
jgi:hypothetical protein